jgi:photosystem II stability/assembly factor-like uncharacterized protein
MSAQPALSCRTAREWLQAPEGLVVVESRALARHLEECAECSRFGDEQRRLDSLLQSGLETAVNGASVRSQVMARLTAHQGTTERARPWRPLSRHAVPVAAALIVGVLLAIFLPQAASRLNQSTPQAIAWRAMHAEIAYPLALDPNSPRHLIAGDRGQIYESRDGGTSWHPLGPLPAGNVIRDLVIDAADPSHYLVATKHSVYVSHDAGRHWAQTAFSLPGAMNMFLVQGPADHFYLGPSILWSSVDRGASWHPAGIGTVFAPDGIQALAIAPNGALVSGIWGGGVAVSEDGGKTWQRRMHGLPHNVIAVSAPAPGTFWAGTDRGVYHSANGGKTWGYRGLRSLRVTSLLVRHGYLLAGGTDGLYRSIDGGRRWSHITAGLPLDPYVYSFNADPASPNRVFASLNTDGIFRSDDGGRTWVSSSAGLPLHGTDTRSRPILFLRTGRLWMTTTAGSEPGLLTVDDTVRAAAVSPDGVSAAYAAASGSGWDARVLSAGGGSLARLVARGAGQVPDRLLWSPTSAALALVAGRSVTVTDLTGRTWGWTVPSGSRVVGWGAGGHSLLLWDRGSGRIGARSPQGAVEPFTAIRTSGPPEVAPDHHQLAFLAHGRLHIGSWTGSLRAVPVDASCDQVRWSDDSALLLVSCGSSGEIVSRSGSLRYRLPALDHASWAPSSHDVLYFRDGTLWRWAPGGTTRLVPGASPAGP